MTSEMPSNNVSNEDLICRINNLEQRINELQSSTEEKFSEKFRFFSQATKDAENAVSELKTLLTQAQSTANSVDAKWKNIEQQVQNISSQKSQASSDASATQTAKNNAEQLLETIKTSMENVKTAWESSFQTLQIQHGETLSKLNSDEEKKLEDLYKKYAKDLSELNEKYIEEYDKRTKEIESLLPGATSAGLASAFLQRKEAIEKNKKWWALLLLASVGLLITFGFISMANWFNTGGVISSFPSRVIIVAGLILLEEFARRNFNVIFRLAEAYAYKEALAMSYLGYKKQMADTIMPQQNNNTQGHSVLMRIFLDKLEDEPGKNVFDKEKHYLGPGAIMDSIAPGNNASPNKVATELSKGSFLTKISWQVVVIVGIIGISACVIAFFLRNVIK